MENHSKNEKVNVPSPKQSEFGANLSGEKKGEDVLSQLSSGKKVDRDGNEIKEETPIHEKKKNEGFSFGLLERLSSGTVVKKDE